MLSIAGTRRLSNCLIFAVGLWIAMGGRIRRVASQNWSGPHFVWEGLGWRVDLVPARPVPRILPPPLFVGVVRVEALEA